VLVPFIERQRWFVSKARRILNARVADWAALRNGSHPGFATIVSLEYAEGPPDRYFVPLALVAGEQAERLLNHTPAAVLARISGARKGALVDGFHDDDGCERLMAAIGGGLEIAGTSGTIRGMSVAVRPGSDPGLTPGHKWTRGSGDQSNSIAFLDDRHVLKLFRRVESGLNPEFEIGRFLAARGFTRTPRLLGALEYHEGDSPATLAVAQSSVTHQGSGWEFTIDELRRYYEQVVARMQRTDSGEAPEIAGHVRHHAPVSDRFDPVPPPFFAAVEGWYLASAATLGRRTGELHLALADPSDPAFAPEPFTSSDLDALADGMRARADAALDQLEGALAALPQPVRAQADAVLADRRRLLSVLDRVRGVDAVGWRMRVHGDYHLGQVLRTEEDFVILDFEGEPAQALDERRAKHSPLKDVAGMVRSFSYAAYAALFAATTHAPDRLPMLEPWADTWQHWVSDAFLTGYRSAVDGTPYRSGARGDGGTLLPTADAFTTLLQAFVLDKAAYELAYELNSRPDWVRIPLAGMLKLLRYKSDGTALR
jgi:maltose alpha-D-glucosyltransferase/alpha-amylase